MKSIAIILLLFSTAISYSQRYALIDQHAKLPILYTDSVSVHQVKQGYFPIEKKDIDTFLANLTYVADLLGKTSRSKMKSFELRSGKTLITVERVPAAYGDKYKINSISNTEQVTAENVLSSANVLNKKSRKYILGLIDYITQNKSLFGKYYEIQPKLYNIVVITE